MESLWENVVLPEDDGPAISRSSAPDAMNWSAICSIRRSCSASFTRMNSRRRRLTIMSFRSAAFSQFSMACQFAASE